MPRASKVNEEFLRDPNAEVIFDSFSDVKNVNAWVNEKTLSLIPNILDEISDDQNFFLINALGIDMEWVTKFLKPSGNNSWGYPHEERTLSGHKLLYWYQNQNPPQAQ